MTSRVTSWQLCGGSLSSVNFSKKSVVSRTYDLISVVVGGVRSGPLLGHPLADTMVCLGEVISIFGKKYKTSNSNNYLLTRVPQSGPS